MLTNEKGGRGGLSTLCKNAVRISAKKKKKCQCVIRPFNLGRKKLAFVTDPQICEQVSVMNSVKHTN